MNPQINRLVKSLLKKESLEQCSLQELEQFAERHPYFGAAQLLLTKKLQTEKSDRYDEQLQKTFLFFNNPLWVQHLLNGTGTGEIIKNKPDPEDPPVILPGEEIIIRAGLSKNIDQDHLEEKASETELPVKTHEQTRNEGSGEELVFEPFHTVDYFASQGIKYSTEEIPPDKLGRQLKSFTDWLKTMKRLPVAEIPKNSPVSSSLEKKVEQLAEHSLAEKEVVTEAMAEVWEKQGNIVKATEIYTKLSLLDPSKNLYFAAKIEALKKKN